MIAFKRVLSEFSGVSSLKYLSYHQRELAIAHMNLCCFVLLDVFDFKRVGNYEDFEELNKQLHLLYRGSPTAFRSIKDKNAFLRSNYYEVLRVIDRFMSEVRSVGLNVSIAKQHGDIAFENLDWFMTVG